MLKPCLFISATKSFKLLPFLFLSMKMLLLVTTRPAARGKFCAEGEKMSNFFRMAKGRQGGVE